MRTKIVAVIFVLFVLAVVLTQVWGSPTYVDVTVWGYDAGVAYGSADQVKFGHTVPSGDNRLLVVTIGCGFTEVVDSVGWGEGASRQELTQAEARASVASWQTQVWYLVAPTVGADSVCIDYATGHAGAGYGAWDFTNVNQSNPIGATADSSRGDEGIEPIVFLTTANDSSFVLTVCTQHGADSGPYTASAGQTEVYDTAMGAGAADPFIWGGYIERLSAGSQACSLDATGADPDDNWAMVSIEIRHIAGAAAGDTVCTVYTSPLAFGSVDTGQTSVDSFYIKNEGDSALVDSIDWGLNPVYVAQSDSSYSLSAGDSLWFSLQFAPTSVTSYPDTQGLGHAECADLVISGTGASAACSGDTLTVCASGCDYTTIAAAYAAASSCDTIEIQDSREYDGAVTGYGDWSKDNIYLRHSVGETPAIVRRVIGSWEPIITITGDSNTVDSIKIGPQGRGNGIELQGDRNTITNCTFDSICYEYFADGNAGEGVRVGTSANGVKYSVISNNTFESIAHAGIQVESNASDSSKFNQLLDNTINSKYGHGITMVYGATQYNLLQGNIIGMDSLSDARHQKSPMQLAGVSHNTVRQNVMYHAWTRGTEVSTYGAVGPLCTDNWFYNNTYYDITWRNYNGDGSGNDSTANNFWIEISAAYGSSGNDISDNKFYNNIAAKVGQAIVKEDYGPDNVYGIWSLGYFNEASAGTDSTALTVTNDWNGNILKNNCIRIYHNVTGPHTHNAYHLGCEYAVRYMSPSAVFTFWKSVSDVNGLGSMSGNFTSDPLLTDTTMVASNWWHIPANSPCVDAGTALISGDINANHGGWDTLVWYGTAPDVGAYQVTAEEGDTCCNVMNNNDPTLAFGNVYVDSTATDSFFIWNCGDSALVDSIDWTLSIYVLASDSIYNIVGGDTTWFTVEFTPTVVQSYPDTNDAGHAECDDIIFSGAGLSNTCCTVAETSIVFGDVTTGGTATDSFYIKNCANIALVDSIDWDLVPAYTLTSDSLYNIAAGDSTWFTVQFAPTAETSYPDTIDTGHSECSDVVLSGTGAASSGLYDPVAKYRRRRR